jgi:uncharacterized membrane protein
MTYLLVAAAALHAVFMVAELYPWSPPALLAKASKSLPEGQAFKPAQLHLVATIVHNAGIYNGIMVGGFCWAAYLGSSGTEVARVMLFGALVAGAFGAITMKSWLPAVQAALGLIGLFLL